jgi:hypothetical protein
MRRKLLWFLSCICLIILGKICTLTAEGLLLVANCFQNLKITSR